MNVSITLEQLSAYVWCVFLSFSFSDVVPRLGETQQVDSTVSTQLDDVVVLAQK